MIGRAMLAAILALSSAVAAAPVAPREADRALLHGAPWQAEIYSNFTDYSPAERAAKPFWELAHRCGGALIAPAWVVTAAHCIDQVQVDKGYRVRLGSLDLAARPGVTYRIDRMVRHGGYDPDRHVNDIALVHLAADAQTDPKSGGRIAPIALNGRGPRDAATGVGDAVSATGWGKTAAGDAGRDSAALLQVDLRTVACSAAKAYRGLVTGDMICASAPGGDTCQGDSGGPLIATYGAPRLVGIVSWGWGCGDATLPGVYVRIDRRHFLDWIDRAMAADPRRNVLD